MPVLSGGPGVAGEARGVADLGAVDPGVVNPTMGGILVVGAAIRVGEAMDIPSTVVTPATAVMAIHTHTLFHKRPRRPANRHRPDFSLNLGPLVQSEGHFFAPRSRVTVLLASRARA